MEIWSCRVDSGIYFQLTNSTCYIGYINVCHEALHDDTVAYACTDLNHFVIYRRFCDSMDFAWADQRQPQGNKSYNALSPR